MMKQHKRFLGDFAYAAVILVTAFALNLFLLQWFGIFSVTPMVFVLGVFLIAWRTQGYFWGVASSLVSVMAVNYAFTYPYWAFNLIRPECLASAVVMLIVSIMTSTLTTQLKRQEQMKAEAEKERMRGNLLRAVSHDLRTPLTSIYGACSAMRDNFDALPRQTHMKLLSDVCADAQWLVRMVENLLSVTRVDAATVRLSKNGTVLEELIDAVLVKFRKHYPDIDVHVEIPEEFVSIPMDAMLISQVLMNLLENAVFPCQGYGESPASGGGQRLLGVFLRGGRRLRHPGGKAFQAVHGDAGQRSAHRPEPQQHGHRPERVQRHYQGPRRGNLGKQASRRRNRGRLPAGNGGRKWGITNIRYSLWRTTRAFWALSRRFWRPTAIRC